MSGFLFFSADYFIWHYGRAVRDFWRISRDLLWFGYHFFSLPTLTRTLFAPFNRIRSQGFSITEIEASLQNITLNLVSRAVGFFLRSIVIATGIVSEIILALLLVAAFLCWLTLPLLVVFLFAFAARILT